MASVGDRVFVTHGGSKVHGQRALLTCVHACTVPGMARRCSASFAGRAWWRAAARRNGSALRQRPLVRARKLNVTELDRTRVAPFAVGRSMETLAGAADGCVDGTRYFEAKARVAHVFLLLPPCPVACDCPSRRIRCCGRMVVMCVLILLRRLATHSLPVSWMSGPKMRPTTFRAQTGMAMPYWLRWPVFPALLRRRQEAG